MTTLDARIELLHSTGMISECTERKIQLLCRLFPEMYGIELTEENAAPCVTHFCMALQRLERGEDLAPMDPLVRQNVEAEDDYPVACMMADQIFKLVCPLSPNERDYVILHILVVLANVRREYDQKMLG